jgi:hypothetical protein
VSEICFNKDELWRDYEPDGAGGWKCVGQGSLKGVISWEMEEAEQAKADKQLNLFK